MYEQQLENLVSRANVRSADRANADTMLRKVRKGDRLTYQEIVNLWAYCNRYGIPIVDETRW